VSFSSYRSTRTTKRWFGIALLAVTIGLAVYFLRSKVVELKGLEHYFATLDVSYIAFAIAMELLSLMAYASLSYYLIRGMQRRLPYFRLVLASSASTALGNSVPFGAAASTYYFYHRLRRLALDPSRSALVLAGLNILTILALVVLSVVGALGDQSQLEGLVSPIDLAFLAAIVALLLFVVLKSELVVSRFAYWINYLRSIRKGREDAVRIANEAKVRTSLIKVGRIETLFGFAAAILNWLFDLAVLFLMLHSTHSRISLLGVVLAYSVGALAANLPLTPGGLGVVEGSMAVALVAFGGHEVPSIAAVVLYRLFSYWLLLPLGAVSHGVIKYLEARQDEKEDEWVSHDGI
jgi:uncharacterized protein (TIRG00374 family)